MNVPPKAWRYRVLEHFKIFGLVGEILSPGTLNNKSLVDGNGETVPFCMYRFGII